MRKREAMQKKITSLRAQMSAGNLVLPRGSRLVVSMPEDKVITTLEYTGGNEEPTVVLKRI